jgi:tripartite-type tricarboxylate transporter receptor subunit TctC
VARLEKACADAVASEPYKATTEKLNATARFLSGKDFRKMFDADSVANAEAVKKAGIK